jgi:hypothetical protein
VQPVTVPGGAQLSGVLCSTAALVSEMLPGPEAS